MNTVTIFTDGASRGNPGPGGFGAIIIAGEKVTEFGGREAHTTNNRMELMAAIKGLEQISETQNKVYVVTDSVYLVKGITEWIQRWQKKGWKTADRKPVLNRDLWENLLAATRGKEIVWKHIAGHADTKGNIRADEIATAFADLSTSSRQAAPELYSGILENYRIRNILDAVH